MRFLFRTAFLYITDFFMLKFIHMKTAFLFSRQSGFWHKILAEVINMSPCELTASITALANALACKLTVNELNLLGAVLTQLGDTLTTIATQRSICESAEERVEFR